jgi:hypothetical protein
MSPAVSNGVGIAPAATLTEFVKDILKMAYLFVNYVKICIIYFDK